MLVLWTNVNTVYGLFLLDTINSEWSPGKVLQKKKSFKNRVLGGF